MKEYRLNAHDIMFINRMTLLLGGYINMGTRTFNGRIGPKEPIKIVSYDCEYASCISCRGGVEVTILEPDMDFDLRDLLLFAETSTTYSWAGL